jgi:hypothetical protein
MARPFAARKWGEGGDGDPAGAEDIRVEGVDPRLERCVLEAYQHVDRRGVHQGIEPAERVDCFADDARTRRVLTHVTDEANRVVSGLLGCGLDELLSSCRERDVSAFGGGLQTERASDAGRRADDEHPCALEERHDPHVKPHGLGPVPPAGSLTSHSEVDPVK